MIILIAGAITEGESLFSYFLDSATFASYQYPNHQPAFLDQLTPTVEQMEQCGNDKQCVYDYSQTGDIEIGLATMNVEQSNSMDQMLLGMLNSHSNTRWFIFLGFCLFQPTSLLT